jgi:hypothetical protein
MFFTRETTLILLNLHANFVMSFELLEGGPCIVVGNTQSLNYIYFDEIAYLLLTSSANSLLEQKS